MTDVASGCREVECNDGRLNSDGDAANGCETADVTPAAPAASSAPAPAAPAVAVDVSPAELSDASTAHITIAVITLSIIVILAFF